MSDQHHSAHFPEEAEQNEIAGPVLVSLIILTAIILVVWAMS